MNRDSNKKSIWDKIHLDPTLLATIVALLVFSALVIWSASGQDMEMTERKLAQIGLGFVAMLVMAQIPPCI